MKNRSFTFPGSNFLLLLISVGLAVAAYFLYYSGRANNNDHNHILKRIEASLKDELLKTRHHFDELDPSVDIPELYHNTNEAPYPFYYFENSRLLYWSDFNFIPKSRDINGDFTLRAIQKKESFYLLTKYPGERNSETIYAIPLMVKYPIVNEYLKSWINQEIFSSENFEISLQPVSGFHPVQISVSEEPLFYIRLNPNYNTADTLPHFTVNIAIGFAIVLFLVFLLRMTLSFVIRSRYINGLLWLTAGLVFLRAVMIFFNYPFLVFPNDLFDPRNYASSWVNPSLGDLFLNILVVFVLAAFLFRYYPKIRFFKKITSSRDSTGIWYSSAMIFLSLILLSVFFLLFNSVNLHSQWSLDISRELNFHSLKVASYIIVIVGGIIYFFLSHIIFRIVIHKYKNDWKRVVTAFLAGTAAFVLVSVADRWDFLLITIVHSGYFFVLLAFNFPRHIRRVQYLTFVYFFVASLPLCIVGAYSVYRYQLKKIVQEKDKLASQLLIDNDILTEYLLNEAATQISEDVFIQNRILNPYVSKINIRQRVQRVYLNNPLEKYDIDIRLFNSRGLPIDESTVGLQDILERYKEFQLDSTLFFINQHEANSLKRYLKVVDVKRYSRVAGYVLIDLKLKRSIPTSVYPMLLIDNRYSGPDISTEYSYAIYEDNKLIFNLGNYDYPDFLTGNFDLQETTKKPGYLDDGLVHFSVKGDNSRVYLISLKAYPVQNAFSNFSFLFTLFMGNILLALAVITAYFKMKRVRQNYASRIQLFLNAAFLIPLIVISISAVSVIVKSYKVNLEEENLKQASTISLRIGESLDKFLKREISRENLSEEINSISRLAETDINIFGNNGRLLATSQPLIYENELLAEVINPEAYVRIVFGNAGGMVLNEHLGKLSYKNTYMPIKSPDSGQKIGILSLPYFDVKKELERNVISVLTNVLNIFTVVFLIFVVLSYMVSTWLTFPLRLITQKIRKTSLLDANEPLEWNSDDEIGLMIGEYNKMLLNLEESKKALARSEKESAWREIARQVAHEIKNPLTPMQLTLQHMKRTLAENQIDREKRIRQIDALLHQISTLSDIATSFSAFAKMPVPQSEVFELTELVRDTIAIYDKNDSVTVQTDIEDGPFYVDADRKWIGQALSNILINGIHATEEKEEKRIAVSLSFNGKNKCLLTIADNGRGISEEIRNKIFMPDFSTKETGSGIGLAIAKRAVEHARGEIWFESEPGEGTEFYIELPVVK